MNVLVIGGAGYIGSHVVIALLESGHSVTVFDDLSTGLRVNLQEKATFVHGSLLDDYALRTVFQSNTFQAVIHLAALKAAGQSMFDPEIYSRTNISGTISILNLMSEYGVKNFVFSSSAATYGNPEFLPITEQHPQKPINYYGYTKLAVEQMLRWYSQLKGIHYATLRYFNAAGYNVDGRIKGLEQNPANLLPIIMEVQMGIRSQLDIFGNDYDTPDGSCIRDYIHVDDLAKAHVMSLEYIHKEKEDLELNLGTGVGISVLEMVETVAKISKKPVPYRFVPRREGDPANLVASSGCAHKILGWKASSSDLETLVLSTWKAYQAS